jgi:riboflavin biosynthesis pyrimidine reductase
MRRLWPDPSDDVDVAAMVAAEPRPPVDGRPWLLVNMIASLDGAITVDGRSGGLGAPADKAMFSALRAVADVVLAGAGTVRAEGYGPARPSSATRAARRARGQAEAPRIAVVSRSLDFDLTSALFTEGDAPPIVITCEVAPPERRGQVAEVAEVVLAGEAAVDMGVGLRELRKLGASVVTCEGGPSLNSDLVAGDLVDEWALTVSPLLVGGGALRSIEGPALPEPRSLRLDRLAEGDGLLLGRWLRTDR